nr:hypothetical protein fge_6_PS127F06_c1_18978 [Paspalum simplex]
MWKHLGTVTEEAATGAPRATTPARRKPEGEGEAAAGPAACAGRAPRRRGRRRTWVQAVAPCAARRHGVEEARRRVQRQRGTSGRRRHRRRRGMELPGAQARNAEGPKCGQRRGLGRDGRTRAIAYGEGESNRHAATRRGVYGGTNAEALWSRLFLEA